MKMIIILMMIVMMVLFLILRTEDKLSEAPSKKSFQSEIEKFVEDHPGFFDISAEKIVEEYISVGKRSNELNTVFERM